MRVNGSIGEGESDVGGVSDTGEWGRGDVRMQQSQQCVVVYVTPSCPQCMLTKRVMDAKGIDYQVVDVTTNENALAYVQDDLGYSQAPVVVVSDQDHWSGFRPDLIAKHIAS